MVGKRTVITLAQRSLDLKRLGIPGAVVQLHGGKSLNYYFSVNPGPLSRTYDCVLSLRTGSNFPEVHVLKPNLDLLAAGRKIPHIYPSDSPGTKLCLWTPTFFEWVPKMRLSETLIPWTLEWLFYFEEWLFTGVWNGGGFHLKDGQLIADTVNHQPQDQINETIEGI